MHSLKRFISACLALVLLLALVPASVVTALSPAPEGAGAVVLKGGKRDMAWPVPSSVALSSCFLDPMAERDHTHYAIDIAAFREAAIVPVYDGTVYLVMDNDSPGNSGYGKCVIVKHTYTLGTGETVTLYSRYAHMNSIAVKQGQKVTKGVTRLGGVGGSGATEDTYPDHLDFQLIYTETGTLTWAEMVNRQVTSIDPFINELVEVPEKLNANGASPWCTCCQDYVKYIKELYAQPMRFGYLAECKAWFSYASLTVTKKTAVYSQPCLEDVLETSADLETAIPGMTYTATALYQNTVGEFWYRVATADGMEGYLRAFCTELETLLYSDVTITDANWPTVQRRYGSFGMTGVISSAYTRILGVRASVRNDTAEEIGASAELQGRSYSLAGSAVDNAMPFGKLDIGGHTYLVEATVQNHYADPDGVTLQQAEQTVTLVNKRFSVVNTLTCAHTFSPKSLEPTCIEPGYQAQVCACGYTEYTEVAALGHDCPTWSLMIPVSCTEKGLESCVCQRCGETQERSLPALDHDITAVRIEESCQGVPMTRTTCTRCGQTELLYDEKDYSTWQAEKPDVEEARLRTRPEYRGRTREVTTDTVQTKEGWTLYNTVTDWGAYGEWSDWTESQIFASDTTEVETRQLYGYYYYACESCGTQMHTGYCYSWAGGCGKSITSGMQKVWLALSWNDANLKNFHGTGVYYTQQDGRNLFKLAGSQPVTQYRSRTRKLETVYHFERWNEWSDWSPLILEEQADLQIETRTAYSYVITNGNTHSYRPEVTAPNCLQKGYTTYTCSGCGDVYRADPTPTTDHSFGEWTPETEATCAAPGTQTRVCQVCQLLERENTDQLPHNFENGSCTGCGSPAYSVGDVDQNHTVNILDVMMVINMITGELPSTAEASATADLTGDGKVNILDVMALIAIITG